MSIVKVEKHNYTVEPFYQWDRNQVLEIYGLSLPSTPEVHFYNNTMEHAIVRQATMDNAGVITVSVPNGLLQKPYTITAHLCVYTGATFETQYTLKLPVTPRTRPADYTIEDDGDVYSFNALNNKVDNFLRNWNAKYSDLDKDLKDAAQSYERAEKKCDEVVAEVYPKAAILSDDTKTAYGLDVLATPDDVFKKILIANYPISSYLAFVGNVNTDMVTASFGKNNEENMSGLGKALAMYAWYKGDSKEEYPFTELQKCQSLRDLSALAIVELYSSNYLKTFARNNSYALSEIVSRMDDTFINQIGTKFVDGTMSSLYTGQTYTQYTLNKDGVYGFALDSQSGRYPQEKIMGVWESNEIELPENAKGLAIKVASDNQLQYTNVKYELVPDVGEILDINTPTDDVIPLSGLNENATTIKLRLTLTTSGEHDVGAFRRADIRFNLLSII